MADVPDPKHTTDEQGVLLAPRFIPELPGRTANGGRIAAIRRLAPALRERPNSWAAVFEGSRHAASNIMTVVSKGALGPSAQWECACRKNPEKTGKDEVHVLYLRHVPPTTGAPRRA